jgi:hypothetical protein
MRLTGGVYDLVYRVPADGVRRTSENLYLNFSGPADAEDAEGEIRVYDLTCHLLSAAPVSGGTYEVRIEPAGIVSVTETDYTDPSFTGLPFLDDSIECRW